MNDYILEMKSQSKTLMELAEDSRNALAEQETLQLDENAKDWLSNLAKAVATGMTVGLATTGAVSILTAASAGASGVIIGGITIPAAIIGLTSYAMLKWASMLDRELKLTLNNLKQTNKEIEHMGDTTTNTNELEILKAKKSALEAVIQTITFMAKEKKRKGE
jgi:5-bromo-4-chloroindolyl phosphate hydrolysis protein